MNPANRKTATAVTLVQWARYQYETIQLGGSTLITGPNTVGKTMILDAMTYCLTGNTRFNSAAQDRDRKVWSYVRGDTAAEGKDRFLRSGPVVSYIALEFFSPDDNQYLVVGVGMESVDETQVDSRWFILRNTRLSQVNFARVEEGRLKVTPPRKLQTPSGPIRPSDLMPRDVGVRQILQALGMRVSDPARYREKLTRMIAFKPENNIDRFIQESVLERNDASSLANLREQKQRYDQLRETFENLQAGRKCLEQVIQVISEYEQKQRRISLDELMLLWQTLQIRQQERSETELSVKQAEGNQRALAEESRKADAALRQAIAEQQRLEQDPEFLEKTGTLKELEEQQEACREETRQAEAEAAKLLRLQGSIRKNVGFLTEKLDEPTADILSRLEDEGIPSAEKRNAFIRLSMAAGQALEDLREEKYRRSQVIAEADQEISSLEGWIRKLEAGSLPLPREVEKAREYLQKSFAAEGKQVSLRTLAELTEEFLDESWRDAVEQYLGPRRFHLIPEGSWAREAARLLAEHPLAGAQVVRTDELPDSAISEGSAAALLTIPHPGARRYANALLNQIRLCGSPEELLEDPRGGLTREGLVAENWAIRWQESRADQVCLGAGAAELQLQRLRDRKAELEAGRNREYSLRDQAVDRLKTLEAIDWAEGAYDFAAPEQLTRLKNHLALLKNQLNRLRTDPGLTALIDVMESARHRVRDAQENSRRINGDLREVENRLAAGQERLSQLAAEIFQAQEDWEKGRIRNLELVETMQAEYEASRKRLGSPLVLREKTVSNRRNELIEIRSRLERAQMQYQQTSGQDMNRVGPAFIPLYQREYQNLVNVRIEKARADLAEKTREMEHAVLGDFVAEINEKSAAARAELEAINQELRQLPFGRDTYRFTMRERPDRQFFFRVANRLSDFMGMSDLYYATEGESDERQQDIRALLEVILREEDEAEYMDYRKYFTYDMQIFSRQGDAETRAELSRKQGSASGGEKQTPYYLIMSAALMQYYPRDRCCQRLVFIDEAFAAMSDERITQMVKYFELNGFQVIYAAPPKKLDTISRYITTTVSLVTSGRYTRAVEGQMKPAGEVSIEQE